MKKILLILLSSLPCLLLASDTIDVTKPRTYEIEEILQIKRQAEADKDTLKLAYCHFWLGGFHVYREGGQGVVVGLKHRLKAIELFEAAGAEETYLSLQILLADYAFEQGDWTKSLKIREEVLVYAQKIDSARLVRYTLSAIGTLYWEMGDMKKKDTFFTRSIDLAEAAQDSLLLAINYTHLGHAALDSGDNERAIFYSKKALPYAMQSKAACLNWTISMQAVALQRMEHYEEAIPILKMALDYVWHNPIAEERVRHNISECYEALGDFENSLLYFKQHKHIADSISERAKDMKIDSLNVNFKSAEKDKEIALAREKDLQQEVEARQQRTVIGFLVGGLLLFGLLAYLAWRFYEQRLQSNRTIADQERQIHDHVVQSLQNEMEAKTIRSILDGQEKERQRIARDLHDGLGGLLSALRLQLDSLKGRVKSHVQGFEKVTQMLDQSVQEVRAIARHTLPEALIQMGLVPAIHDFLNHLKSPDAPQIDFQYYGDIQLSQEQKLTVYRMLQELVNNAIKYAQPKEIMVLLVQTDRNFSISVDDDGIGFDLQKITEGSGMKNLRHRCNFLKGELIVNSRPGEGSSFMINFKV